MLRHLPHPTLLPTNPSNSDLVITAPPPTAARPWQSLNQSTSRTDFPSASSSRSNSPSRSSKLLPFLKLTKERSVSPELVSPEEAAEFENTLTEEQSVAGNSENRPGKLASWFNGTSEPVNISLVPSPVKEKDDPFFDSSEMDRRSERDSVSGDVGTFTKRPSSRLQQSTSNAYGATRNPAGSKFAFWRPKSATTVDKHNVFQDEFTELDVQTALFPSGTKNEQFPEDFNRLQVNAEYAIRRLQAAYQKSSQTLREVNSEKIVLTDELEAAQTRGEHLKLQLADMVAQSVKQDSAMQAMAEQLAAARHQIREDAEFRGRSLRIVTDECEDDGRSASCISRRRKRDSAGSSASGGSSRDSLFSDAPPGTCTPLSTIGTSPVALVGQASPNSTNKECQNCHGVERSEAWDVVQILKEESRALKARIAECEGANQDALSLLEAVTAMP